MTESEGEAAHTQEFERVKRLTASEQQRYVTDALDTACSAVKNLGGRCIAVGSEMAQTANEGRYASPAQLRRWADILLDDLL